MLILQASVLPASPGRPSLSRGEARLSLVHPSFSLSRASLCRALLLLHARTTETLSPESCRTANDGNILRNEGRRERGKKKKKGKDFFRVGENSPPPVRRDVRSTHARCFPFNIRPMREATRRFWVSRGREQEGILFCEYFISASGKTLYLLYFSLSILLANCRSRVLTTIHPVLPLTSPTALSRSRARSLSPSGFD